MASSLRDSAVLSLLLLLLASLALARAAPPNAAAEADASANSASLARRQGTPGSGILRDFEVHAPVLTPEATNGRDAYGCVVTQTLMEYQFANSYGHPFVGQYTPPKCSFNRVTINFTVTSQGRQFDRLALMYLGDNEVWRTSTAEPSTNGIVWSYVKEMQQFNALWQQPQTLIFDLGNTVDSTYTGPYNTTLTATFFTVPNSPPTADQILPISQRAGANGSASVFQIPSDNASVAYTLPPTVARAVVSLSACGQIDEEFWYSNVFDADTLTFGANNTELGHGPWREVQLLIDGQLAGVSWPFPVIFTGGVVPGLWRPIVSIEAFDLREHEIDITPWLGLLLDGASHRFEIRVASVGALDGRGGAAVAELPGSYWLVTGKIFLFLDPHGKHTTASKPRIASAGPNLQVTRAVTTTPDGKANSTLRESTRASRSLTISATVNGRATTWQQNLQYTNTNFLAANGTVQNTTQTTSGTDRAAGLPGATDAYFSAYSFPLTVNQQYGLDAQGNIQRIDGDVSTALDLSVLGASVFPSGVQPFNRTTFSGGAGAPQTQGGSPQQPLLLPDTAPATPVTLPASLPPFNGAILNTTQSGSATYLVTSQGTSSKSYSFGQTSQQLSFKGTSGQQGPNGQVTELYRRNVRAVNTTIVQDYSVLLGIVTDGPTGTPHDVSQSQGDAVLNGKGKDPRK